MRYFASPASESMCSVFLTIPASSSPSFPTAPGEIGAGEVFCADLDDVRHRVFARVYPSRDVRESEQAAGSDELRE